MAEAERELYERLKAELRTAAAALSLACFAACYYFYGRVRRKTEQRLLLLVSPLARHFLVSFLMTSAAICVMPPVCASS